MEIHTQIKDASGQKFADMAFKVVDSFNIQTKDHYQTLINQYSTIAKAIMQHDTSTSENWNYIEGTQKRYYGLYEALYNKGIIKDKFKVMDVGCGVCSTLYNLSKQFKQYDATIECYGVEYNKEILELFQKYLYNLWNNANLSLFTEDLMDHNYSEYDLILSYLPFKNKNDQEKMYTKIFDEMKPGALFFEHWHFGVGVDNLLMNMEKKSNIKPIKLLFGGATNILFTKFK